MNMRLHLNSWFLLLNVHNIVGVFRAFRIRERSRYKTMMSESFKPSRIAFAETFFAANLSFIFWSGVGFVSSCLARLEFHRSECNRAYETNKTQLVRSLAFFAIPFYCREMALWSKLSVKREIPENAPFLPVILRCSCEAGVIPGSWRRWWHRWWGCGRRRPPSRDRHAWV